MRNAELLDALVGLDHVLDAVGSHVDTPVHDERLRRVKQ